MTDLTPGVRDRAIAAAGAILCDWVGLADAQKWAAPPVVDAVVAVVAPEIERPLQARITELEAHNAEHRAQVDDLQEWNERLEGERDAEIAHSKQAAKDYNATFSPIVRERDALQARVEELEAEVAARKRSGEALNTECEQTGEKADDPMVEGQRWLTDVTVRLPEYEQLQTRVELLTAALTGLCNAYHVASLDDLYGADETISGEQNRAEYEAWVTARAALAAGTTDV